MRLPHYGFIICACLLLSAVAQAQFNYATNSGVISITKYTGSGGVVTVPNGVTIIGHDAFYFCGNLTSITIPDSVTNIGRYAFYYCTNLADAAIPNGITFITNFVFSYCSSLTNITIPSRVTFIGTGAFKYCENLKGIYFKGNAPILSGGDPFEGDTNLTVYHLEESTGWGSRYGGRPTALWKP